MPADKNADENRKIIEAALFIAARPMSLAELYNIVNIPKPEIKKILESMKPHYDDHGVRLVERDEHYELQIKDAYVKHVEHLAPERDFSRATMQTLSLIAFRSPVKQSEIVEIRGNRAYDHVKELLSKGLIRSEPQGHTNMLHITKKFLEYFNISSQEELKTYFAREGLAPTSSEDADVQGAGEKKIKPDTEQIECQDASEKEPESNPDVVQENQDTADEPEQKPKSKAKKKSTSASENPHESMFSDVIESN